MMTINFLKEIESEMPVSKAYSSCIGNDRSRSGVFYK